MKMFLLMAAILGLESPVSSGNEKHEVDLSFDSSHTPVDVYVIQGQVVFPDSLGVTLLDSEGYRRVFELKALEQNQTFNGPPRFHASLDPSMQSYAGFELRIPFTTEPPADPSSR